MAAGLDEHCIDGGEYDQASGTPLAYGGRRAAGGAFMGGFRGVPAGPIGVAVGAGAGAAAGALIPESVLANN